MDLNEMKDVWNNMEEKNKIAPLRISEVSQLKYNMKTNSFRKGEVIGLLVAYSFASFVLYNFNILDDWYLRLCGGVMAIYLLLMPLYTLFVTWKMKHIDLVQSDYKNVLEQFYASRTNLKRAEGISFVASPFLFVASIAFFTKLFTGKNVFTLDLQLPVIILIVAAFVGAVLFNVWVFRKREKQFKSVEQLLEDEN